MTNQKQKHNTSKHTPGPWVVLQNRINGKFPISANKPDGRDYVAYAGGVTAQEEMANARLIAAASELLAAAKKSSKSM